MDSLESSLHGLDLEDSLDDSSEDEHKFQPFRFFDLPAELRRKILDYKYKLGKTLDINIRVVKLLSTFRASKQFHAEAAQSFYSTNTFRLLPTEGPIASRRAKPLIKCFPNAARAFLTSVELRLGPGWTNPPKCWIIDDSLGLEDAISLRVLKVFIEIDPSHPIFEGFRSPRLSYADFACDLLKNALRRLPSIKEVQVDTYKSVTRDSPIMIKIMQVAHNCGMHVSFGPAHIENNARNWRRDNSDMSYGMVPFHWSSSFSTKPESATFISA